MAKLRKKAKPSSKKIRSGNIVGRTQSRKVQPSKQLKKSRGKKYGKKRSGKVSSSPSRNVGSTHGKSVLKERDVMQIRTAIGSGRKTQAEVAAKYSVSKQTINDIVKRRTWTHV